MGLSNVWQLDAPSHSRRSSAPDVTRKHACIFTHTNTTHTTMCIQDGDCPLHTASQNGHDRIVEIFLQAGATVDLQNKVENYYS